MAMVNRSAILLIPKQPYADWANAIDHDGPRFEISEANDELTVYLGPELDPPEAIDAWVNKNFALFFENWLHGWCTDPVTWPKKRTAKMFRAWFDVRIHTVVEDTLDAPLEVDDW
jgi:hypothetical protein